ncbi:MAG: DUF2306 domain-containing protein [Anaerolineales bacterium]|nr:DUF2306 domain-containing protein [Anaerolineales bacterium]
MNTKSNPSSVSIAWFVPAGLIVFSALPLLFGALRLNELITGAAITPANARFFASPLPVVVHIVSSAVFAMLGAFQFVTGDRRRWLGWHRAAGWVSVISGLLVGLTGLWMTLFYARAANSGDLLFALRLVFGSGMIVSIGLGLTTIRRRDVLGHRAWMIRAYAIGLGAATQVLTGIAESLLVSQRDALSNALFMGTAWVINLAVAEWAIRRQTAHRAHAGSAVPAPSK